MTDVGANSGRAEPEIYDELAAMPPLERAELMRRLIAASPGGVRLPQLGERRAVLDGAPLAGAVLARSDLTGATLRGADLTGATLDEATLDGADMVGAILRNASLAGGRLRAALLEDAQLQGGVLRFADAGEAILENADLRGADLWGANLRGADLTGADLRGAVLTEADLRGCRLVRANLRGAVLGAATLDAADCTGADLREAVLDRATLRDARLCEAQLQQLALPRCDLHHVHLSGAVLERTRLSRDQLGDAVGEECSAEYHRAGLAYLALERNFLELGDPDSASWCYRRRRRMQKLRGRHAARTAFSEHRWWTAVQRSIGFLADQVVEWLCDYGESVQRVLAALLIVYVVFVAIYGVTGSVVRTTTTALGITHDTVRSVPDLLLFSLTAMSSGKSVAAPTTGLEAASPNVHLLIALQSVLGIVLLGLFGFVLGNRVRR